MMTMRSTLLLLLAAALAGLAGLVDPVVVAGAVTHAQHHKAVGAKRSSPALATGSRSESAGTASVSGGGPKRSEGGGGNGNGNENGNGGGTGYRKRLVRVPPGAHALREVFESIRGSIDRGSTEETAQGLRKLQRLMVYCDYKMEELDDEDLDSEDEEDVVAAQLAAVLGIADLPNHHDGAVDDAAQASQLAGSKRAKGKSRPQSQDKQEITRLKRVVKKLKEHQASGLDQLVAVKKGVEALVESLSGTKRNLQEAKQESAHMGNELQKIHKQADAAAQLQREITEIQEHARINYETGLLEMETGEAVARSVSVDKYDRSLADKVDPAVLHADLRLLLDIVLLLGSATIGGMVAAVAYFPPIIGYIAGGVIVGPSGLDLVVTVVELDTLASFGSIFFLFAHGLEYSFSEQKQFQTVSVGGCLLSTAICAICIQVYALASGILNSPLEGGLLGLSCSLSSLSLVLDYLHAQRAEHTEHGKVMVGFLTFQGLMMGLLFSIPPSLAGEGDVSVGDVGLVLFRSFCSIVLVAAFGHSFSRFAMPTLLKFLVSRSEELFLLGVVSLAMVMALFTEFLGLSLDFGSFCAGVTLAGSPFVKQTAAAIQPLASVFAAMLFASIGMIINPSFFWANIGTITIVVVQIVVVKFVVITTVLRLFSYSWQTCITSAIGLSHVGEFSLLFSSKLQAHHLLSRRAYLIFLSATVTTIVLAPLVLRTMHLILPQILRALNVQASKVPTTLQ